MNAFTPTTIPDEAFFSREAGLAAAHLRAMSAERMAQLEAEWSAIADDIDAEQNRQAAQRMIGQVL